VPLDANFQGGSNDTISGRVRLRRPYISLIFPDLQKAVVNTVYFGENLSAVSLKPAKSLSAVSLTPANNFSAVSLTPAITFSPGVVDTGQK
jgi:hypothetical protein